MMENNRSSHQPDENLLFTKALNRLFSCMEKGSSTFTDFLDPEKILTYMAKLRGRYPVCIDSFGGYDGCERQIIGFSASELLYEHFPVAVVFIRYNSKFASPEHKDFLGALCGLGIDRSKMGDILLETGKAVAFVHEDICDYICANLERVGNTKVRAERGNPTEITIGTEKKKESRIVIPSMRLDAVISAAYHLSRSKSAAVIAGEKAQVNWNVVSEPSKTVKEGDVITLRGSGRIWIERIDGSTKKGKLAVWIKQ